MITKFNVLIVGCGDIGIRLARCLPGESYSVAGLRRHPEQLPDFINPITCDLSNEEQVLQALAVGYDFIVLTLTPAERNEAGYRQSFSVNVDTILRGIQKAQTVPSQILFVSSTSVYGQDQGEWIDETSTTKPMQYNGQYLLQAEKQFLSSGFNTTVVRFSGIYGPGRERLIKKVKQGNWDPADQHYTNRIHADDCAGVLAFLLQQSHHGQLASIYLASDDEPASMNTVCTWLQTQLGVDQPSGFEPEQKYGQNKRCNNQRLRESGYQFKFPSFREGYTAILSPGENE